MNVADSFRLASALEQLGYEPTSKPQLADVIVLNTCVIRQSAEDKAIGRLSSLRPLKDRNPNLVINLMGCLVGVRGNQKILDRFPWVDVVSAPSDPRPLLDYLREHQAKDISLDTHNTINAILDGDIILPKSIKNQHISAFIPIVYGCSHACTYCIIPYKRGVEHSRPYQQIIDEARSFANQGIKEITLLGQIVDRYGLDLPERPTLAQLLYDLHDIEGILRIRFLTSHPNWMTDELINAVQALPKVCPHIEVPIQSGDDVILQSMRRGYSVEAYRQLISKIREKITGASIATDIIVGFPGETDAQFENTYQLLADLRMDVAHLARYSPRAGTYSARKLVDNVPDAVKMERFRKLETLQEEISSEINARLLGKKVSVLFEEKKRGRWRGRTPTNKLIFAESEEDLLGKERDVLIKWTGPWSMIGTVS